MKKLVFLILSLLIGCAPSIPFISGNHGPVNKDLSWNAKYSNIDNESVVVRLKDIDRNGIFNYGDKIHWYIDSNKDKQLDVLAKFTIIGGNQSNYFRPGYPYEVKVDIDHDGLYDYLIRYNEINGTILEKIKIHSMVMPVFFDYSKQRGFSLYGLDKFVPFVIICVGFAVIFKTDKREAR